MERAGSAYVLQQAVIIEQLAIARGCLAGERHNRRLWELRWWIDKKQLFNYDGCNYNQWLLI